MAISFDEAFGVHQYTMKIRNTRSEVLAGNLANADTPGFKARDLDFNKAFEQEADVIFLPEPQMVKTSEKHMDENALEMFKEPELTLKYRNPYQTDTGNGNTVEVDTERMKYAENTLEYQAAMQFLNGRITKLTTAIKGQ